jgi:hypothetical protein
MANYNFVSGAVSTVSELDKDEAWLQGWLKEQPERLGLGKLEVAEGASDDDHSFVATDDDRCFSVDVQLGEMEASQGFGMLDNWARNRVRHPDKTHVAVLVTETLSDRYETTLETLAEHLPLVVVELQIWKGEAEAIVVPHVALSSDDVDLSATPAAKATEAMAKTEAKTEPETETEVAAETEPEVEVETTIPEVVSEAEAVAAEAEAQADAAEDTTESVDDSADDKDDTGVGNPWGLPKDDAEDGPFQASGNGSTGLLSKVGN